MNKKQKKTILKTMGGITASTFVIGSVTLQPVGQMKKAINKVEENKAIESIYNSALYDGGNIAKPHLAKAKTQTETVKTYNSIAQNVTSSVPDYVAPEHLDYGTDTDGNQYDLITQDQAVTRDVTLTNGETYTEVYGYQDDLGNYMDELPTDAAIGIENTPAVGNGDGQLYTKYTSRDSQTINFYSGAPSAAVHGKWNTMSANGPTNIYDASDGTWHSVSTGTTSGVVGNGDGGYWNHKKTAGGSSWPAVGWNAWHGSSGNWNSTARQLYFAQLWDYNLSASSYHYFSGTVLNNTAHTSLKTFQNYGFSGWPPSYRLSRSQFIGWLSATFNTYGTGTGAYIMRYLVFGGSDGQSTGFTSGRQLSWQSNVNATSTSWMLSGQISTSSARWPWGNGTGDYYSGSEDDDWTYTGPVFYSSYPTSYSGSTTIYGDATVSSSTSTSGTDFWDTTGTHYTQLPKNAEKDAITGSWNSAGTGNQPGVGDESGNYYYQGTRTAAGTQDFKSGTLFTEDSMSSSWQSDVINYPAVGDGSGRTYERATYYYDKDGNILHDLPTGEFMYTSDAGNLFNTVDRSSTGTTNQQRYEGQGIAQALNWISANQSTLTLQDDFVDHTLNINLVVTDTDTQYKKTLIAIQSAITLLAGSDALADVETAMLHFQQIVQISDADRDAITNYTNSNSTATHRLQEGHHTAGIDMFGVTFNIMGSETDIDVVDALLDGDTYKDFFAISSSIKTLSVEKSTGTEYVYYDSTDDTQAEDQLHFMTVSHTIDLKYVLLGEGLRTQFTLNDWGLGVDSRAHITDVYYSDFDYDKNTLTMETVVHIGDKSKTIQEQITFENSYMDYIMDTLSVDQLMGNADMLAEQPLLTTPEYSVGSQTEVEGGHASFSLLDSFNDKFLYDLQLLSVTQLTPPTEDQTDVEYEFLVEYEGHQRTFNQTFTFAKTRSQKYIENAVALNTNVPSTVTIYDKTIAELTSRSETFQAFEDFLVADGNTAARMTFDNIQLVGGGDIDRDATQIQFQVDIHMGTYTLAGQVLTLDLNHSVNEELINNLTEDEITHTTPGIVTIVDELADDEWNDSKWWVIQSSWLEMIDIAGIAVLGNFTKIDERHFSVELEVTIGSHKKTIVVTQKVGFNLNFADVLDESTTGISDPIMLEAFREYMLRFDAQASVIYVGNFLHAFDVTGALPADLLQAWQGTISTLAGDAIIRSVELTDINAVTKYDRDVSFRITLEDSRGNTKAFDKVHRLAISPVAHQFSNAVATMLSTTQTLSGQLTDAVLTAMKDINDYTWLTDHLNLLDTVQVISVTNTGKTANVIFEFGYSGHLGSDSKQVSIDYVFDRRGDKDTALTMFGLGYTEAELSTYYDINNVDANGNDWKNVEQLVLDNLIKLAAQSQLRDDMENEITALHASIFPHVWADQVGLRTAIDAITTTDIMTLLQAEILASGTTRTVWITSEMVDLRNEKIENLILSDLAVHWKMNSTVDTLNEILKYDNTFDIQDHYLADVVNVVENATFVVDLSLEIAHATILPHVLDTTLYGVSNTTELDYHTAVTAATNNAFVAEYASNLSGTWTNLDEFIALVSDSVSQIIIDNQITASAGIVNSTTHYNDRSISELVKDLTIFTDEEIKIVGYDVENSGTLDKDASTFNIEVFMTFGSIVNQRHVLELQLDKSIHQAILDQIQTSDIEIKDFLVKELANELELEHYGTWDKFGLSSSHVLGTDGLIASVDASSFTILGDAQTSPDFTLDFTFTLGTTTRTLTSQQRIGMNIIFDLKEVDASDTELLEYLRGYDVGDRIEYHGTWLHPYEILDATDAEVNNVLVMYDGLVASGVKINDIYVHNRDGISEFAKTITLKIVAEDVNGFIKVFDKVITFGMSAAEWAFGEFDEGNIDLLNTNILNGMLTDAVKTNILGEKSGYVITNHRNPIHIDDPIVRHLGKTATVSWRVWYDDGQAGGVSNSKVVEIDYVFDSRGSKDEALAQFGLGYDDGVIGINVDWTNVDGTNDWTNVEQDVLDELVRGLAETQIRSDLDFIITSSTPDYVPNVWATQQDLTDEILIQTDVYTIGDLALNIYESKTTRQSFIDSVALAMQRDKVEENILTTMQARWNQSSTQDLLDLIGQLNSIIDVKTYYQHDMDTIIQTSTYALDIARQMEIDSVRNAISEIITVGLNTSDTRYTIYTDVIKAKLDNHYDTEQASGFTDVRGLIQQIADSISNEAMNDLLTDISSSITASIDEDSRVLADVYMNLQTFDNAGVLHSNIEVLNGDPLSADLLSVPLSIDLTWGSVSRSKEDITMNLNKTISQAMIDEIKFDEIGLIDPRLAPTADQVDENALTADLFGIFSRHILGTDVVGLTINTASFTPDPIEPREFTMDVTVTIGAETRIITILASVGFDIDLDWESIDLENANDTQKDMYDFMSSYVFQDETEFYGIHTNPWQLRDETDLLSQFSPSRNLRAARGEFIAATLTDPSAITKYTRSIFITITVEDKNGVTYDFNKEVVFAESYIEATMKEANSNHFDIISSINLSDMLTDATIGQMSSLSAYDVDPLLNEFDIVELLTLQQSGKTATATYRISYHNGNGYSGSKIITKDYVFASRGSKDDAVINFGLGYTDNALNIDWTYVDSIGNDWTNVEQSTLDQLVSATSYAKVRYDLREAIVFDSVGYVNNVFGSIGNIDIAVEDFADNTELKALQTQVTDGVKTRPEWLLESKLHLQTTNVEQMILESLASEWKLFDESSALAKAEELYSGFNISDYYADINTLVDGATFDDDQARQIGYDVFRSITRDLMNIFHSNVDAQRDIHYDTIHTNLFESKFDQVVTEGWTQLNEFEKEVADAISRQFLDDEIAKIMLSSTGYPSISGLVDLNTRMLNDVSKDFGMLESEYIDVSNIRLTSNGTTLGGDLTFEQIYAGLSFGSVVVDDIVFTLEFNQTINFAIMEAISAGDIRMTEYRTSETTDKIDPDDILAWMFTPLSSHLRGSDSIVVGLDPANPFTPLDVSVDPYLRRYTIGITLSLGAETRTYFVEEKLGQLVVFGDIDSSRWVELEIINAADEVDFIAYNDSYPYVESVKYVENFNHVLDVQSASEQEWLDALAPTLYVLGGGMSIAQVELKDTGTYTKYDKEFTFILTLQDQWGDQKVVEKTITLANSAVEYALLEADESTFNFIDHDNTTAMLTDDTLANILTNLASFSVDTTISQYLDISNPIVEYKGKTATVGFQLSYDDGRGYADSRVIQIDVVFASRGSKDEAMANYSLGYDNARLGIDWNTVDNFANDWTNVEQEVLDNLVKVASQIAVRVDINDRIVADAAQYIVNVWNDQLALSNDVDVETTYALLADLQAEIIAGNTTRVEFVNNLVEILKIEKIESLLYENMAALLRMNDPANVEARAQGIKSDFDIKDYYLSNKDGIVQSSNFVDTITYEALEDVIRKHVDYSMLASANPEDEAFVTTAIDTYINEKVREVFAINVWTNDSTIVSHTAHLISEQAIQDALDAILHGTTNNATVLGQITRDDRNVNDLDINWAPLTSAGLYLSNLELYGSSNGDFLDRDTTVMATSISVTFGTILDTPYSVDVELNQTLNQAIADALTATSITLRNAKLYADVDFMLEKMGEDDAGTGSNTITNASYFESAVDFMSADDATIAIDPASPLVRDPDSGRIFSIGLIVTVGNEVRNLEIRVQVGESIDFSLPEFSLGGSFDFTDYFIMTSSVFNNPYDLHQAGDDAINHIGIDPFLISSFVAIDSIIIEGNDAVDIFSRQYVATYTLIDRLGRTRTFPNQPVIIPGGFNKAEKIMEAVDSSQILLDDANILHGQLTDQMLDTTLFELDTYKFGNELDLLNDLQVKEVTNLGKFATVTFIVGYDDGNGATDHIEYTYTYEFDYRADVPYSLDYYGLGMTADQLNIHFTEDERTGNVEQDVVDTVVIEALTQFIANKSSTDLNTFVDAGIFTGIELRADITAFLDNDRMLAIAVDGQTLGRADALLNVKQELTMLTLAKSYDIVAANFLKANNWAEVEAAYPDVASNIEASIAADIAADTFDAKDIQSILAYEVATQVAPRVEAIAQNGTANVDGWLLSLIGESKNGWMWIQHSTILDQLRAGFDDAPVISPESSPIHTNENSANGWFVDEIAHLTSFADMETYLEHLSGKIARFEIPAEITSAHLSAARIIFEGELVAVLQTLIDDGTFTYQDINAYLDVLLDVDYDHPQGYPDANFDAIFSPQNYYNTHSDALLVEQLEHTGNRLAEETGMLNILALLSKNALYININNAALEVETHVALYTEADTIDKFKNLHEHYTFMLMNNLYENSYTIYRSSSSPNINTVSDFLDIYVSKMDVHLSNLEGINYLDQDNLDTHADLIAQRVGQIMIMPDIQGIIDRMIVGIGLVQSELDDAPYKDLLQFTITEEILEAHLYDQALILILQPGGIFDQVVDQFTTRPEDDTIAAAKVLLDDLMTQAYPVDAPDLDLTIKAAILFADLNDDYYQEIVDLYNTKTANALWKATTSIEEARASMAPVIERVFEGIKDQSLDLDTAADALEDSKEEVAVDIAWTHYEEVYISIFDGIAEIDPQVARISFEELEEYVTDKLGYTSIENFIGEYRETDKIAANALDVPDVDIMYAYVEQMIGGTVYYAQELYDRLISDIATIAKLTPEEVLAQSSIVNDVVELKVITNDPLNPGNTFETISDGGTSTEIKALRANIGMYAFELMINISEHPNPEQNINGWLIPFAALITKTDDYSKITQIITDKVEAGEDLDFESWGFEGIADIMNTLIDTSTPQDAWNTESGKIVMDKFIRSDESSSNAWSTTMWLGPVPIRMTYGNDGDISKMQTVLMDREDPETIKTIGLSTKYNTKEMTLRLGMDDGTTVYIRYVEDADGHTNVILERLDTSTNTWLSSEMYRERDLEQGIERKTYDIFRDSNIESFHGSPSEFEEGIIQIYPQQATTAKSQANSTGSTIDHVWGTNPTVDSSTDTGNASADTAVVSKDDEGNTHIQLHLKDMKITNTSASMTAVITSGGFTLMWLIWTFLGGLATIGTSVTWYGGVFTRRKGKQRRFFRKNPQYKGASLKKTLLLRKMIIEKTKIEKDLAKLRRFAARGVPPTLAEEAMALKLADKQTEFLALESLVLAEAEAAKFQKGFISDIKGIRRGELSHVHLERSAAISKDLEQRTTTANKYNGGKFVENRTQEFMVANNNKKIEKTFKEPEVVRKAINAPAPIQAGPTRRSIENGLAKIKSLKTTALLPDQSDPRAGVDFSPVVRLGAEITSVSFKRSRIDRNYRDQVLSIVLYIKGKNVTKDVKVSYKYSINENIIRNIGDYNIDLSWLARFKFTNDPKFNESFIKNSFKISAPGARVALVTGSLNIINHKEYSGKLKIKVGALSTVIPFKASL